MTGISPRLIGIALWIVAIHDLNQIRFTCARRIAEYCLDIVGGTSGAHPTVLHIAGTCFRNTGTRKRSLHTEVIDTTAKLIEQRVVETVDIVAVTMDITSKAYRFAYRIPLTSLVNISTQNEFQILSTFYMLIQQGMTCQTASRCGVQQA